MSGAYPRVTQILSIAGLIDSRWFTVESRDRGSALHLAAQYLEQNDLDWATVDPTVLPRLRQYQKFLDEVKLEVLAIEEEVVNEALQYAGRLDRRVKISGREGVLDLKSPSQFAWVSLQLALYAACFQRPLARWSLHLSDERYRLVEHKDRHDWDVAKAALTLANWKRSKNGEYPVE